VANEVFAQISDKEQSEHDYAFHATCSAFEIQDEVVTDLLRPSTRGLVVSASAEEGVMIPGLYKETAKDEMSMRKLFNDACENRACHSLPVGGSIHTSAAIWEIHLSQSEGLDDGHSTRKCHSRLIVLDLPCVDSLVKTDDSQPLQSLTLHRSLFSFMDVVYRLSSPSKAALAPFRTSKLTHYLSELLGGNAIVVGLGMIVGNEAPQSKKTMEIVSALGDSVHFPIGGRELTDVLSGLLGKYRAMILQLQDEIENGAPVGEKAPDISEKVVTELQRDLAAAQLDRNIAREDRQRIFEMMELLKAKYSTVIDDKTKQSQELIRAEEDKLSVARALVELKLEHSAKQEQGEKDKFEITSALLAAKNEIFDLDQQLLLARTEGQALKDQSDDLERHVKKDLEELVQVKAALQEVREQLQRETEKNLDLGAELLTLLNQKSVLQHKVDDQQQRLDVLTVKLSALEGEEQEADKARSAVIDSLRAKEDEISKQKRAAMEAEMEAKRLRLELDHFKQDAERQQVEWIREREASAQLLKETEFKLKDAEKNRRDPNAKGGGGGPEGVDRTQITKLEHKIRDLQREVKRARDDEDDVRSTKAHLEEELQAVRKSYQKKLSEQILNSDNEGDSKETVAETDEVLSKLMDFYQEKADREHELMDEAQKKSKTLKLAMQALFDKYQAALDQVCCVCRAVVWHASCSSFDIYRVLCAVCVNRTNPPPLSPLDSAGGAPNQKGRQGQQPRSGRVDVHRGGVPAVGVGQGERCRPLRLQTAAREGGDGGRYHRRRAGAHDHCHQCLQEAVEKDRGQGESSGSSSSSSPVLCVLCVLCHAVPAPQLTLPPPPSPPAGRVQPTLCGLRVTGAAAHQRGA